VLVIEDTHWMDEPSRELLAGLLSGPMRHAWMVVLTRRPGDDGFVAPSDSAVTTIPLEPLGLDEAKTLIYRATEDSPLPSQQVERLAQQAQGSPLFLVELLQTLRRSGSLEEIPQSVEAMIAARIDTLPLSDRNVLRRFSVLGAGFQVEQTSAVLEEDAQDPGWRTRTMRRLTDFLSVDAAGRAQFHHALIRDVAYAGLPFRTRQDLHARVGDSIFAACDGRPEEFAELLSLHYFHAGRWSRSWLFSQMAGDRARDIYANHEAATFYKRALESSSRLAWVERSDRARVLTALAKVQYEGGSYRESLASLRAAIRLAEDPVAVADLRLDLARSYQKMGALPSALRETALGVKAVEDVANPEARAASARLRSFRAGLLLDQLRPRMALKVGLHAVEEAEASGDRAALAWAYTNIDEAYQILGMRDQAVHEERALEIYEELGDLRMVPHIAMNLGVQAYADGHWDEAIALYSKAQEVSGRSGNLTFGSAVAANLGEVLISRGSLDEAEAVLQEARRVLRGHDYVSFALFAETQLARLMMERGQNSAAIAALTGIIDEAKQTGQPYFGVDAALHLADALTRSGEPGSALEVIGTAQELAGEDAELYSVPLERLRAAALIALARPDEALGHLESALASAREQRLVYEEAQILMLEAAIGAGDGASDQAQRLFRDLGVSLV
jgi:tetratricopeptide (TPR) repeat protein